MKCTNCQAVLPDHAKFCSECGHKFSDAPARTFCTGCGAALAPDEAFCGNCGTRTGAAAAAVTTGTTGAKAPRWLLPVLGTVAAVALAVLLLSLIPGKSAVQMVYLKDGQLQHLNLSSKDGPQELTGHLTEDGQDAATQLYSFGTPSEIVKFSGDGKFLFYPEKLSNDTYTLYRRDLTDRKGEPVKIDSGISGYYQMSKSGKRVAYLKDGKLYLHDMKEKTKVDSDVWGFRLSGDGKSLLYMVGEEYDFRIYLKKGNQEEVKLASGVTELDYISEDLSVLLYRKEDKLYFVRDGKEPVKVDSDVDRVERCFESGACYYYKRPDDVQAWTLITDDVGGTESTYQENRFRNQMVGYPLAELYYFDGKETTLVTDRMYPNISFFSSEEILLIPVFPGEDLPRVRLSDYLQIGGDITGVIYDTYMEEATTCFVYNGKLIETDLEDLYCVYGDGRKILAAAGYDEQDSSYTLYELKLSGDTVKSVTKISSDVSGFGFTAGDQFYYRKDGTADYTYTLYYKGEKIAKDVSQYPVKSNDSGSCLYYVIDETLYCWNGKESVEVHDDITYFYQPAGRRQVVFGHDYNKHYEYDLSIWNGKESTRLDKDIYAVITFFDPKNS